MTRAEPNVVVHRSYPEPVEDVWSAFTESDRLARWIGSYTGTGRPGGTVEFTMTGEVDAGGEVAAPVTVTIHECVAPRRLAVEIPQGDGAWQVRVDLTPTDGGTDVVFTQRPVTGVPAADIEAGWSWYLDRLGATLRGLPMPAWSDYTP